MHKKHIYALLTIILCSIAQIVFAQDYHQKIQTHRETYKSNFIKEVRSPLKQEDFEHLHFYNPDENFNVLAKVKVLKNQKSFTMPTFDGSGKEFKKYAELTFSINNQSYTLTAYKILSLATNPAYQDYLFIPYTDLTNGKDTYAGGRYLDAKTTDISKKKIYIDFNKTYNPYCAYSDGYRCPVPPQENDLNLAITAGEKNYTGEKKKAKQ